MKKIYALFICSILMIAVATAAVIEMPVAPAIAHMSVNVLGGGVPSGGTSYPDILLWIGFENCTSPCTTYTLGSDDYSEGDSTLSFYSDAVLNTDAVNIGINGFDRAGGSDYIGLDVTSNDIVDGAEGVIGFYIYVNTWTSGARLFRLEDSTAKDELWCWMQDSDEVYCRLYDNDAGPTFTTSAANIGTGTWYYIEVVWQASSNLFKLYVDDVERGSSSTSYSAPSFSGIELEIGANSGYSADFYIDNFAVSNDSTRDLYALRNETTSPR